MRVAVVDDEAELAGNIVALLEGAGIGCDQFANGKEITAALRHSTYDVVLLDWNMPGMTGLDVLAWANRKLATPPAFIILTGRSETTDIVRGLQAGACDYIVKPEDGAVILARVHAAARRTALPANDRYREFGAYRIDNLEAAIQINGTGEKLTAKEFELARLFFENVNRPLSRAYLLSEIWGSNEGVQTRTLDVHVSRIRSKLALRPENGFVIQTVFGFGYRMDSFEQSVN